VLTIDASKGEGGGQVVRSALALSLATGIPFALERIRAGRRNAGLGPQHVVAVQAACAASEGTSDGATEGSPRFTFKPRRLAGGQLTFDVGGKGSAVLVTQTLLPALLRAPGPSEIVVHGGTHMPAAPAFDHFAEAYLGVLRKLGADVKTELWRHGFPPEGAGAMRTWVSPRPLGRLELLERGRVLARRATAKVAKMSRGIAEREITVLENRLRWGKSAYVVDEVEALSKGNVVVVTLRHTDVTVVDYELGNREDPAEVYANALADRLDVFLATDIPVDSHLADQIVLPLALAGGGRFRTVEATPHLLTQLDVVRSFLPDLRLSAEPDGSGATLVTIG
jgi:RNA 3'-terminal phosphate cyclase (ATP)